MFDEYVKIISTVGFPIVVAGYLLIRLEGTIKELTDTVSKLILVLAKRGIDLPEGTEK